LDFFQALGNIVVPRWVKLTVIFVLLALLAMNLSLGFLGITGDEKQESWIEAAIYLFGVLLPIWLIAFVVMYSDGGPNALKAKTYDYMTKVIPQTLKSLVEEPSEFYDAEKKRGKSVSSNVRVLSNQYKDSCIGSYILTFLERPSNVIAADMAFKVKAEDKLADKTEGEQPPKRRKKEIRFSLELNVRKANLIIFIPCDEIREKLEKPSPASDAGERKGLLDDFNFSDISGLFPHTITGSQSEGYLINESLAINEFDGKCYYGLVFFKRLEKGFLTLPQEKLYFAQDLMFMLKAFYNEQTDLFDAYSRAED